MRDVQDMTPSTTFHWQHKPGQEQELDQLRQENAAVKIQKAWRAKLRAKYLKPNFRWSDLTTHAQLQVDRTAADDGKNLPRERWRRALFLVNRLDDGDEMLANTGYARANAVRKHLETQHWLELIDGKHRYGSNLKYYHKKWEDSNTSDNFFRWLDHGEGKTLSLKECPREQLENEIITYLSSEQRLNYLVQIDSEGKLRWARNGELVDTTAGRWKDAGGGRGIIPLDHPEPSALQERTSFVEGSPTSSLSEGEVADAMHYYANQHMSKNPLKRLLWRNFTLRGFMDRLLRKTIKRNTWIYVSDKNFNIFIGIKSQGTFQHSTFLGGGLVTSAGLISVKDGLIHTLSPLSGHYRTSVQHFKQFLKILEERGVDMRKVEVSKAEFALWAIEHITKFKKKQKLVIDSGKEQLEGAADDVKDTVVNAEENVRSWKRAVIEGRHPRVNEDPPATTNTQTVKE